MPPVDRFIALFDILGFKSIVCSNGIERVESAFRVFDRQIHLSTTVPQVWGHQPLVEYRVFSDTFFAFTPDAQVKSLRFLAWFCRNLISSAFNTGLKLRGAVAYGPVVIEERLFIGEPILRAYLMERSQEWVGCWIDDSCFEKIDPNSPIFKQTVLRYPIPRKRDNITDGWVTRWSDLLSPHASATEADIESVFLAGSQRDAETREEIAVKLTNTIKFIRAYGPETFWTPQNEENDPSSTES